MRYVMLAFLLVAIPVRSECGPITYSLRDARFFGDAPGPAREEISSGVFTPATNASQPEVYSTGGPSPVTFTGLASAQGTPMEWRAAASVVADASTSLAFNIDPFGPTNFVSLVQSRAQENNVVVTGGSGVGYLLPHFQIDGAFTDTHGSAFGNVAMCVGLSGCLVTSVASSSGGVQTLSQTFTPAIGAQTEFTFGTPFSWFFFVSSGIFSETTGTLAPGSVSADFRTRLIGFSVVDANGNAIDGAVVDSDLAPVPEPAAGALLLLGLLAARHRRRGRGSL